MGAIIVSGDEIKAVRKRHGLTQKRLAQLLGVTHSAISQWETGRTEVAPGSARKLAQWMEMADCVGPFPEIGKPGIDSKVQDWRAANQTLKVKVSPKLLESAAELGLDLQTLFESVGTDAVRNAMAKEWSRQNADFIRSANEELERNGLWNEDIRLW